MIMALLGSPRRKGNTETLLEAFLQGVGSDYEVETYRLEGLELHGCKGCGACYETGECIFDDAIKGLYKHVERAEALVISSPIYFTSVTSQLKVFIDRAQPYWARKYLLERESSQKKLGFFISVGGMEEDKYFPGTRLVVASFFNMVDAKYHGDLFFSGIDERGDIEAREGALDAAREAGRSFVKGL